jgi:hypothetical protein
VISPIRSVKLDHLYRLTDSTGIYQHARLARPNAEFGYCLDDNARALIVAIRALALIGETGLVDYVRHFLAFVERCQRPDGRFRNFVAADGSWLEEVGSQDSNGRAIWALGFAARHSSQNEVRIRALRCLDKARPALDSLTFLRSRAFALLGLAEWCQAEPSPELDALIERLASGLASEYESCSSPDWLWFEDELTYSNARLSQALLGTRFREIGLQSLAWLCRVMEVDGCISLIGSAGWYRRGGGRADYDQQPVDAASLVSACISAFRASNDERFRRWAELSYGWFSGQNIGRRQMIDDETGGCYDGLRPDGAVNQNQGAESLLAWLLAWEDMAEQGWI